MLKLCLAVALSIIAGSRFSAAQELRKWPFELATDRFRIHGDFVPQATDSLTEELAAVTQDIEALLEVKSQGPPIHIVLFETDSEYRRYMNKYFPNLPRRRALFIQDRGPGMLFTHWHRDVGTDLRHEVAHSLLNSGQGAMPLWLDEGLAEYFEMPNRLRFTGNPYHPAVAQHLKNDTIKSLDDLALQCELAQFSESDYRDSWAWVHFLIHRKPETRGLLIRYLKEVASGAEALDLGRSLHQICPHLDRELADHFCVPATSGT